MYDESSDELFAGARSRNIWLRGLLMLVFLAVLWFIRLIVVCGIRFDQSNSSRQCGGQRWNTLQIVSEDRQQI